jgi:hypothetical protein
MATNKYQSIERFQEQLICVTPDTLSLIVKVLEKYRSHPRFAPKVVHVLYQLTNGHCTDLLRVMPKVPNVSKILWSVVKQYRYQDEFTSAIEQILSVMNRILCVDGDETNVVVKDCQELFISGTHRSDSVVLITELLEEIAFPNLIQVTCEWLCHIVRCQSHADVSNGAELPYSLDFTTVQRKWDSLLEKQLTELLTTFCKTPLIVIPILTLFTSLLNRTAVRQRWISFESNELMESLLALQPAMFADITVPNQIEQVVMLVEKLQTVLNQHSNHSLYEKLDSREDLLNDMPKDFICPITLKLMEDPVLASDGHSYERTAIERWLRANNRSPKTNTYMSSNTVYPNHALKALIEEFVERKLNENLGGDTEPPAKRPKID